MIMNSGQRTAKRKKKRSKKEDRAMNDLGSSGSLEIPHHRGRFGMTRIRDSVLSFRAKARNLHSCQKGYPFRRGRDQSKEIALVCSRIRAGSLARCCAVGGTML